MVRLTGWTAIEVAERGGQVLSKHADPTEGARSGLTVGDARAVADEDPSLIYLDLPAEVGRVGVGGGKVWLDHPAHGWLEMPARYDVERVTEEDLAQDSQLRRLSDREVRDIGNPEPATEVTSVYIQTAVAAIAAGEVDAAAGAVDVAARELGADHPEVHAMRERVKAAAGGRPLDAGAFRAYRHRVWGSEPVCIEAPAHSALAAAGITGAAEGTMGVVIDAIRLELDRLDANDDGTGLEVEAHPAGARFFDTQESAVYEPTEALDALRALPDGAGFEDAWQALAHLEEAT